MHSELARRSHLDTLITCDQITSPIWNPATGRSDRFRLESSEIIISAVPVLRGMVLEEAVGTVFKLEGYSLDTCAGLAASLKCSS